MVHVHETVRRVFKIGIYGFDAGGGMAASFILLAQATKVLPLGTSYAIWTGIGASGAVIMGIVLFREPATALRIFFVALLLTGILGLKMTSGH